MSKHPRFFMSRGCGVPIRMYRGTIKIEGPAIGHRGNPFSFRPPPGDGRCFAPQGMRIATPYGLAMTVVGGWLVPFRRECGSCSRSYRGTAQRPFPTLQIPNV